MFLFPFCIDRYSEQTSNHYKEYIFPSYKKLQNEELTIDNVEITMSGSPLDDLYWNEINRKNVEWGIGAFIMGFVISCIHTKSIYMGFIVTLHAFFIFPVGYVIYRVILGYNYIDDLAAVSIYLFVYLGVDFMYVVFDTWLHSINFVINPHSLEERLSYTARVCLSFFLHFLFVFYSQCQFSWMCVFFILHSWEVKQLC